MPKRKRNMVVEVKKRRKTAGQKASLALSMVKQLKSKQEFKWLDSNLNYMDTTATVWALGNIAQGDDYNERIGLEVNAKSLQIKGQVLWNPIAGYNTCRLVILIFYARGSPTPANVYDYSTAYGLRNPQHAVKADRHVLYDKTFVVDAYHRSKVIDVYKRLHHKILFEGVLGSDRSIGSIWAITYSDAAVNTPTVDINTRLYYTD